MILDIVNVNFIYSNLDKLFNINFMMLAFIITAITILQTLQGGRVEEFKATGLFDDVIRYYNSSIKWNFISGSLICILWFLRCEFKIYQIVVCIVSFILFFYSMRVTYKAYSFLIYFIKKQKK